MIPQLQGMSLQMEGGGGWSVWPPSGQMEPSLAFSTVLGYFTKKCWSILAMAVKRWHLRHVSIVNMFIKFKFYQLKRHSLVLKNICLYHQITSRNKKHLK